jgi:membrane associated rhomboid family serine protease
MSMPDVPEGIAGDQPPGELVEAGFYSASGDGFEHGLVILAMGHPYWLVPSDSGYRLLVEPPVVAMVREQLACFDRESAGWPPAPAPVGLRARRAGPLTPLVWVLAVLAAYRFQAASAGSWEAAGALDSGALFDRGEWWRPVTALFLHADLGHLLANVTSGFFVFSAVLSTLGRGRGWLLLTGAAVSGNVAAAALYYPGSYEAIGASTAVFAGLGLLTGRAARWLRAETAGRRWRTVFVPLAAGATLLALFGAGGLHTDVVAHATGFAAGLALGALLAGDGPPSPPSMPL